MGYLYSFVSAFVIAYVAGVIVITAIVAYRSKNHLKGKGYSHFDQVAKIKADKEMLKNARPDEAAKDFDEPREFNTNWKNSPSSANVKHFFTS